MSVTQRDRQREATRQRLYEAALQVFRRDTVSEARIDDIARVAGVSRPTFYFHFPTKQDVLLQLQAESEAAFEQVIDALPAEATIHDVFRATAHTISERWANDPKLFVEVGMLSLRRAANEGSDSPTGVRRAIGARFAIAAERGVLSDAVPAQVLADLYLANTFAVALGWASDPDLPLATVLELAAGFFLHGTSRK
jgi:AcrR family transcriptional regulator